MFNNFQYHNPFLGNIPVKKDPFLKMQSWEQIRNPGYIPNIAARNSYESKGLEYSGTPEWIAEHQQRDHEVPDFDDLPPEYQNQFGTGNIDLNNRPVHHYPGTNRYSSLESLTTAIEDGKYMLLPMISDSGELLSLEDAVDSAFRNRKHLGIFNSQQEANERALELEDRQKAYYDYGPGREILYRQGVLKRPTPSEEYGFNLAGIIEKLKEKKLQPSRYLAHEGLSPYFRDREAHKAEMLEKAQLEFNTRLNNASINSFNDLYNSTIPQEGIDYFISPASEVPIYFTPKKSKENNYMPKHDGLNPVLRKNKVY